MKRCPDCEIEVGGNLKTCPLCGKRLKGEPEKPYWPEPARLKKASRIYRIQLAVLIGACAAAFIADAFIDPIPGLTWWPLFFVWTIVGEIIVRALMKRERPVPRIITDCAVSFCVLVCFTAIWFANVLYLIPVTMTGLVIVDFIFAVIDKDGYSIVFFLWADFLGALAYFIGVIAVSQRGVQWHVLMGICLVSFIALFFIKGRFIFSEIKRRMSM